MPSPRKSDVFLFSLALGICFFALIFVHAYLAKKRGLPALRERIEMVRTLQLTDLCLFTDARYTRHPSMADLHTPFQDHAMSFEHFPSGSLVTPPPHLRHYALER
jgi:hypothetical protein